MGWWSETVMGGDIPLDYADDLQDFLDIEFSYDEVEESKKYQVVFKNKMESFNFEKFDISAMGDSNIGLHVIGIFYLASGAEIPTHIKHQIIEAINDDDNECFNEPSIRKKHMDDFLKAIIEYDKVPTFVCGEGLFEAMEKKGFL